MLKTDKTHLNIQEKLQIKGNAYIGKGCRIDVGSNAKFILNHVFINVNCLFVIKNGIEIGDGTVISWNCQFLDDDFHTIYYKEKKEVKKDIKISKNVLIGTNSTILKVVSFADCVVVTANSVVTKSITAGFFH